MNASVETVQIPGLAVADVFIQHQRLVLGQNSHGIYAGIDTVGEREINDTIFAPKGTAGFASFSVKAYSLEPCPPANSMAIISFSILYPPIS